MFQHYSDSYKLCKVNINIISWLGIWFINNSLYESAIAVFKDAALIQPLQIKWRLMIASCLRRMRSFHKAIAICKHILDTDAARKDAEIAKKCLQYLVVICKQIGDPEMDKHQHALDELRLHDTQTAAALPPPSASHTHHPQPQHQEEEDDNNWADVQLDDELLPS